MVLVALEAVRPDFLAVALFGDDGEAESSEEIGTDGEGEELVCVEGARVVDDGVEESGAESLSGEVVMDDEGADLMESGVPLLEGDAADDASGWGSCDAEGVDGVADVADGSREDGLLGDVGGEEGDDGLGVVRECLGDGDA